MENTILQSMVSYGPFAVLFVSLFFYTIKNNEKREVKYQETIDKNQTIIEKLANTINLDLTSIKEDIKQIANKIK